MKTNLLNLFTKVSVVLVLALFFSGLVNAQVLKTATVYKVNTDAVTINGLADEAVWSLADKHLIDRKSAVAGQENPTFVTTPYWQAVWDVNGIYLLITTNDDLWFPIWLTDKKKSHLADKPEIYVDVSDVLKDGGKPANKMPHKGGTNAGDYQFAPDILNPSGTATYPATTVRGNNQPGGFKYHDTFDGSGKFIREAFLSWDSLFVLSTKTTNNPLAFDGGEGLGLFGFDITCLDMDAADQVAPNRQMWCNNSVVSESYQNGDYNGRIQIVETLLNTGIKENRLQKNFIYPTLAESIIYINAKDVNSVAIYSITGKLVFEAREKINSIEVSQFESGIYFVKARNLKGEELVSKFVKK